MPTAPSVTADAYLEKSHGQKLWEKTKRQPFVPIGIAGMFATVMYGAYNYRNKGNQSTSVFLMHLRVKAQSMVVGAMTLGVAASLINEFYFKKDEK